MNITRRQALGALGAFTTVAALPSTALGSTGRKGKQMRPLGIQLFTLRGPLETDFQGTLNQVAALGYREVEMGGGLYNRTGAQLRQAFDQAGLTCPSAHMALDPLAPGAPALSNAETVEALQTLGVRQAVVPLFPLDKVDFAGTGGDKMKMGAAIWQAGQAMTPDDWKRFANAINERGSQLASAGMTIAYHNHNLEFARFPDGSTAHEILIRETDPALVKFELDIGWVATTGVDVVAYMKEHASRINQLHLKDLKERTGTGFDFQPARLGAGLMDWPAVLKQIEQMNLDHVYVEQEEPYEAPPIEEARIAFEFLRSRPELMTHSK